MQAVLGALVGDAAGGCRICKARIIEYKLVNETFLCFGCMQ